MCVLIAEMLSVPAYIEKWRNGYPGFHTVQNACCQITRETKMQIFQYKLVHLFANLSDMSC